MILFINACAREDSRTGRLARCLLGELGPYKELNLYREHLKPLDRERLAKRDALIAAGEYDDPIFDYAKEFASADTVVIAAPLWDYSFPSVLKVYIENIYATGIVSRYDETGCPVGLCRASRLWFVSTAGGPFDPRFGYEYVKALAETAFGIPEVTLVKAENLDIFGNDPEAILAEEEREIRERFS